jgi:hypothetical protein
VFRIGPGKRVFTHLALVLLTFVAAAPLNASPIKPDIRKLLQQQHGDAVTVGPARAGWDGPESARAAHAPSLELEMLGPEATQRAVRASLSAVAVPDWRVAVLVLAVILVLRNLHHRNTPAEVAAEAPAESNEELPRAA